MKRIVVLGSTGSIGRQTLDIARAHPDAIRVVGLAAGSDVERLRGQLDEFQPEAFAVGDAAAGTRLLEAAPAWRSRCAGFGVEAVCAVAGAAADVVLNGLSGYAGLRPSLAALEAGTPLALANKESMVVAGPLLRAAAAASGADIRPVDSEHSAIAQCLRAGRAGEVRRLVLTASGGPFRTWPRERLAQARVADALRHPTWAMGAKITVDSATLMNKGLEILEAHALFDIPYDAIDVVVHPQSIVHSLVEFVDGSVIAQLGTPDMRLPIWIALQAPARVEAEFERLDLAHVGSLTFEPLDRERFPCVGLAVEAGRRGGTFPAVLNAANEVAVAAFLDERIAYAEIAAVVAGVLDAASAWAPHDAGLDLEAIATADSTARRAARTRLAAAASPA
jgi:1-deoxy-D-xylulose-5-phosphate reductoisomerase